MRTIAVNLGNVVSAFEDLPIGSYLGEITKVKIREATEKGKYDQLMVRYMVIDGDLMGRFQTHWLSFSPNSSGFMKDFFSKFGLGELPNIVVDEETDEVAEPDLVGSQVIFKNTQDKKDADRIRTSLVSVEENTAEEAAAPAKSTARRPAKADPEPAGALENQVEAEPEPTPAEVKAAAKAARIAAAQAALAAAAEDDDDDEPEEAEAAPAPKPARTAAPRPAAAATEAPVRRTLR